MSRSKIFCFTLLLCANILMAQDQRLADQYYNNGEYEKAVSLYLDLLKANNNDYLFQHATTCLMQLERFEEAIKVTEKQIKLDPKKVNYLVTLGTIYQKQGKMDVAKLQFDKAVEKLPEDRNTIFQTANLFTNMAEYDYALRTYERAVAITKDEYAFAFQMADLYQRKDDLPKMVRTYLNATNNTPTALTTLQTVLLRQFTEPIATELQAQLMERAVAQPQNAAWPELLAWLYLQKKDYKNAFRQLKALDRMLEEDGMRVFNLAESALRAEDFDAAIQGYDYIIGEKGPESPYYLPAKHHIMSARRDKIVRGFAYTETDLLLLEGQYRASLEELGLNNRTAPLLSELAHLEGIYLNRLDTAIQMLLSVINTNGVDRLLQAESKLDLADFYLMSGDPWEATLLYSQVDKAFKDDILGQEARFRNAKLSYYQGDFDWAKTQFDVLKSGTTRLISNDAIDMSVFIMDNSGLDSITEPLFWYAEAELLLFQNKFDSVLSKLDDIHRVYPEHNLADDILYLKARMFDRRRFTDLAISAYSEVVEKHKEGIRADNSLFRIAELTELAKAEPEKAKILYERLFIEFSSSTFAVEARKRYRILRGDILN